MKYQLGEAQKLIIRLTWAEIDSRYEPDTRQMIRSEREALQAALASGNGQRIATAHAEALRVAEMWNVDVKEATHA